MTTHTLNHPIALARLLDTQAPGWELWEPEALKDTVEGMDSVDQSDPALDDLLGALQVLRAQPEQFWDEWEVFENCAHAFSGGVPDFSVCQPVSPAEAAFGVHVATELSPGAMAYEVKAYIETVLHAAGISQGVGPLADISDRSAHPDRRQRAQARFEEIRDQGQEAELAERDTDIEAARMLAVVIYLEDQQEALGND